METEPRTLVGWSAIIADFELETWIVDVVDVIVVGRIRLAESKSVVSLDRSKHGSASAANCILAAPKDCSDIRLGFHSINDWDPTVCAGD